MKSFFDLLGVLVAIYVVYSVYSGSVMARSGISWRRHERDGQPRSFWSVIAVYSLLAIALITIF